MKVIVTGAKGQLGYDVVRRLESRGHDAVGIDIDDMDITDGEAVIGFAAKINPDAVIHCAAWTDVDSVQENRERAFEINARGTENIAYACKNVNAKMIYISTDYVFDGSGTDAWKPDCTDLDPVNVYGASKLDGERAVTNILKKYFIVRTSWLFGSSENNFVKTMLDMGKKSDAVNAVSDIIGTPTYTYDLARLLIDMAESSKYGIYHATNGGGYISLYDFACEIFKQAKCRAKAVPAAADKCGFLKAPVPHNVRLDKSKLAQKGFRPLPYWKDALSRYLLC